MSKELNEAVDKAMESEEVNKTEEETSEEVEEKGEEASEESGEEESDEDELTPEQLAHAKNLYKRLSDPKTSVETITGMVKRAGYKLTEVQDSTIAEKTEVAVELVDILKEELGDDFELVSGNKLASALAKVLDMKMSAALKPLQTKIEQAEYDSRKKDVDKALDWAYTTLEGFKQNESLIIEKMQTYPYTGKGSYQNYLTEMHALVTSGAAQKRSQRSETNLKNDVKASKSVRTSATKPTKSMSLDEAIEMALSEIK